jgi:hypothetical protein
MGVIGLVQTEDQGGDQRQYEERTHGGARSPITLVELWQPRDWHPAPVAGIARRTSSPRAATAARMPFPKQPSLPRDDPSTAKNRKELSIRGLRAATTYRKKIRSEKSPIFGCFRFVVVMPDYALQSNDG